jgi:hypothetical protein
MTLCSLPEIAKFYGDSDNDLWYKTMQNPESFKTQNFILENFYYVQFKLLKLKIPNRFTPLHLSSLDLKNLSFITFT